MSIDRSGKWFYRGSEITKRRMLKFFASLLSLQNEEYFLITPHVKYRVSVEECPLMAVDVETEGQGENLCIFLRTNMDDIIKVGKPHPLCFEYDPNSGNVLPKVQVRDKLQAKLSRAVYYRLADLAVATDLENQSAASAYHIWSDGERFQLL